jgi:amino acid transporter
MSGHTEEATARLRRVLGLRDLVLFNLAAVLNLSWTGTAAKAGWSALTLWALAALLFFVPQGLAVVELSSAYPEEGGVYAWTKREFGEGHGFLCGWCYWINNVLFYPSTLLAASVAARYAFGLGEGGIGDDWTYSLVFTMAALWLAAGLNVVGLGTGKWLQNAGGAANYAAGALLILFGLYAALTSAPANPPSASAVLPAAVDFSSLNFLATIAFAYAGLELSATMGDEIENPRRNLPRAVYWAAPVAAAVYVLGTGAVLWLLPVGEVNVTAAPFQAVAAGAGWRGVGALVAVCVAVGRLGSLGAWLSGPARVAFVIGLDRYFPSAFGRVHARYGTPHVAILTQAVLATAFTLVGVLGKGTTVEHAFLTLIDMSLLLYFIPFAYLFLCFVRHLRRTRRAGRKVSVPGGHGFGTALGLSGLLVTLFSMAVALVPPPETAQPWLFELKVAGGTTLLLLAGGLVYLLAERRQKASTG